MDEVPILCISTSFQSKEVMGAVAADGFFALVRSFSKETPLSDTRQILRESAVEARRSGLLAALSGMKESLDAG